MRKREKNFLSADLTKLPRACLKWQRLFFNFPCAHLQSRPSHSMRPRFSPTTPSSIYHKVSVSVKMRRKTASFPPHPKRVGLAAWAVLSLRSACWFLAFFSSIPKNPLTRDLFRLLPLTPEMGFSRSLAGHGSQYMWDFVPICPLPSLLYSSSLSKLRCLLSYQPNPSIQS